MGYAYRLTLIVYGYKLSEKTILCVDDDELSRLVLLKFIESSAGNYSSAGAKSGNDCLSFVSKNKVDLIILDYNLGDMSGAEVCKMIPSTSMNPDVPIIIASVVDRQDLTGNCDYQNVVKIVQKPYYINNFHQDILDVLGA